MLKRLRILDLACGSGAFLIEAFDQLHALYEASNARLEELRGQRTLFDLDRQILQNNLYGVDLNAEAIQICQLSLWIKTAARGKRLTSLDHTIREGNSIISDSGDTVIYRSRLNAKINRNFEVFTATDFLAPSPSISRTRARRWSATTAGTRTRCAACATGGWHRTWSRAGRASHRRRR